MNREKAQIIAFNTQGITSAAAAARISTGEGDALGAYAKSGNPEKDLKLIGKVLSSGHHTIIEHAYFTVAFNDVSVLCEQLMIEHRLASYTVKSRRYVNFSGAGFVMPEGADEGFRSHMEGLFAIYSRLLEMGIPKEDARFVLPYCFRSNFIMSMNARELIHIIGQMLKGCLSVYPEMRYLGEMLKTQLDEIFPGISEAEYRFINSFEAPEPIEAVEPASPVTPEVELVSTTDNKVLESALQFSFRKDKSLKSLVHDERPRELETLSYTFKIKHVSLATLTHFTRHRILGLMVEPVTAACENNRYVVPDSVSSNPEALKLYTSAFENVPLCEDPLLQPYYALAGETVDLMLTMNARELLHFLRLRTCTRAQWEVRGIAKEMLAQLVEIYPELFKYYGPSCAVLGRCTEGKLSCGRLVRPE